MLKKTVLSAFVTSVFASVLGFVAFIPRAEATYSSTQVECVLNLCIVYAWVRTEDENGNFTGYVRYEVSRYWKEWTATIDP